MAHIPMNETTRKASQAMREIASDLDQNIEKILGERVAFTLIIYTEGRASYLSTTDRETGVEQLRNLLKYWEEGMPDIPAHEIN